jgi:xanthosine utilization system XapX-like protein
MTNPAALPHLRAGLTLDFPQSLGVYDDYTEAQKAVDFLSDNEFPVENCLIVGTDLKQLERVTGRLTRGRAALGGLISGAWLGLFVGFIFALLDSQSGAGLAGILATVAFGALFGVVWSLIGYQITRGPRDFTSVMQVVATQYEVLVEHKFAVQARELLTQMDPMAAAQAQAQANVDAARRQQESHGQESPGQQPPPG